MEKHKEIIHSSFWQLLSVYVIFIVAIAFGYMHKYSLHFNILALIIAFLGVYSIKKEYIHDLFEDKNLIPKKLHVLIFILSILLIISFRTIPYIKNGTDIPIGYDAGLYNYIIEHGFQNMDLWIRTGVEPGFLYFMTFLNSILNIPSNFLLIHVFILFNVLLGVSIYFFSKEYFNDDVAILSILIYSISTIQFEVFTYLYYKNIIALSLLLFSFYFLKKQNYIAFTILGILIGITHRPTFYIFGWSFLAYTLFNSFKKYKFQTKITLINVASGIIILSISLLFYLGKFKPAIINLISPVLTSFVDTGTAPGTFVTFLTYQFSILFYLPLSLLGLFLLIKEKKFSIFFFFTIITGIIVYFKFFFFNRYIIFLDISLILLAAYGLYFLLKSKKNLAFIFMILLLSSGLILTFNTAINTKNIISNEVFDSISNIKLPNPSSSYIISISSQFSPFLQGYTGSSINDRVSYQIIAPGMFDYDVLKTEERWNIFWEDLNASEIQDNYKNSEIYLFTPNGIDTSENICYTEHLKNLYKWSC